MEYVNPNSPSRQYVLLIYGNEAGMMAAPKEALSQMTAAYGAYTEALKSAKVYVGGDRLKPTSTASSVRTVNGKTAVLDGPFAETKEQLAGYYIIEVPSFDEALSWAAKCPGTRFGTVEVRAIWEPVKAA